MKELETTLRELRLAEQAILKQALDAQRDRAAELEAEVTYLRRTLNEMLAVPRAALAPAAVAAPRTGALPRRWRAA